MIVSYETIRRWCENSGASFAHRVKSARRRTGSTWHLDEVLLTLRGEPYLLLRAVDQHGAELHILLQQLRDKAAAKRLFKRVLASCREVPRKIVTDQLRSGQRPQMQQLCKTRRIGRTAAVLQSFLALDRRNVRQMHAVSGIRQSNYQPVPVVSRLHNYARTIFATRRQRHDDCAELILASDVAVRSGLRYH